MIIPLLPEVMALFALRCAHVRDWEGESLWN